MKKIILLIIACLIASPAMAQTSRIVLTAPRNFYVSPAGTDSGLDCLQTAPCRSMGYAARTVQNLYDLNGQKVNFIADCNGSQTNPYQGVQLYGPFVGQTKSFNQVSFVGDTVNNSCLVKPTAPYNTLGASGDCFSSNNGAYFVVDGFKCDMTSGVVGPEGLVAQNIGFMYVNSFTFGNALNPTNDYTVTQTSSMIFSAAGNYRIEKDSWTKNSTFLTSSNFITVDDASNLVPNMGISGTCIPPMSVIVAINWNVVQFTNYTTCAGTNASIRFGYSGQSHGFVSSTSTLMFGTNCGQVAKTITITGEPAYYDGFFQVQDGGNAVLGATWSGAVHGYKYRVLNVGVLNDCGASASLPGDSVLQPWNGGIVD